jgi:hypothetical protein
MTRAATKKRPLQAQDATATETAPQASPRPVSLFDYSVEAELFPTHNRKYKRAAFGYRRFSRASEAIRFAIEQLPSDALAGAYLEVKEKRFDRHGIQQLYDSEAYPLARRQTQA